MYIDTLDQGWQQALKFFITLMKNIKFSVRHNFFYNFVIYYNQLDVFVY